RAGWRRFRRGDPTALPGRAPSPAPPVLPRSAPAPPGRNPWRRQDRVASVQAGTPPPRYRSTGEKSGASSALVEPAGDLEERLDEVFAMPRRDDMGHLVGDRPRVGRTPDQDLPTRRDVDTALPVIELFHHLEGDRLDAQEECDVVGQLLGVGIGEEAARERRCRRQQTCLDDGVLDDAVVEAAY